AIWRGASTKDTMRGRLRHLAYSGGWKKFEPLWDLAIRTGRVRHALPLLETVLSAFGERSPGRSGRGHRRGRSGDVAVGVPGVQADDRGDGDQGQRDQGDDQHAAPGPAVGRR